LGENVVSKLFVWFLKFSMFNACVDLMQWYLIILNRVRKKNDKWKEKKNSNFTNLSWIIINVFLWLFFGKMI
jgi:hypothetical protein